MSLLPYRRALRRPKRMRGFTPAHLLCALAMLVLFASARPAHAIPAFARQTGASCADCHAGAYGGGGGSNGPNLTPYGMRFKLNGFTDTDGNGVKIPVSAQLSETHLAPAKGEDTTRLSEADLYVAGRVSDHVGGFAKVTATDGGNSTYTTKLTSLDLRFVAKELKLGGKDFTLGVSVNNTPGLDDPLAVLPAAALGPSVGSGPAGTFLNTSSANSVANRLIGATVYGLYDSNWYGEIGTYRDMPGSVQDRLGYSGSNNIGHISDTGYVRFAYMKDLKRQFFSIGVVGLTTRRQLPSTAPADRLDDLGYDLSYQFLGNREHIVQASYVNILEKRKYGSVFADPTDPGRLSSSHGIVHDQVLSLTYTFKQAYGVQLAHMLSTGTHDPARFQPFGTPDTTSNQITLFWTPFGRDDSYTSIANLRLAATWFRFTKTNGMTRNVFGAPLRADQLNAADLNAFIVTASLAF